MFVETKMGKAEKVGDCMGEKTKATKGENYSRAVKKKPLVPQPFRQGEANSKRGQPKKHKN